MARATRRAGMRRNLTAASVALMLALVAFAFQSVTLPPRVAACSCAAPLPTLAELARESNTSIVVATVGHALPDRTPLAVEGWFHGAAAADLIWLRGGTNMMSSCDVARNPGSSYVLVVHGGVDGVYSANSCAPSGEVGTDAGNALLAEATTAFGSPVAPPEPEPPPAAPLDLAPWLGGLAWVAAAAGAGVLMFGALALIARRRPTD